MSTYTLLNAGRIIAGPGSIESIASVVADLGGERALIVTDRGVAGAGLITRPQSLLAAAGVEVSVIDTVPPEPDVDQVNAILAAARPMAPQVLIGIGGGSVMDVVKVVAVLLASNLSLRDLLNQAPIVRRGVPPDDSYHGWNGVGNDAEQYRPGAGGRAESRHRQSKAAARRCHP
jgi:alcohol dehydrogenase class IV